MMSIRVLIPALLFSVPRGQEDSPKQVREWVEKLRSERIEEREEAVQGLKRMGKEALEALRPLLGSADAELAVRAREISAAIEAGLAQRAYGKLEEALHGAKTVNLAWTVEWRHRNGRFSERTFQGSGTILMKEGGKARMAIKGTEDRSSRGQAQPRVDREGWILCDGHAAEGEYFALNGTFKGGTRGPAEGKKFFCTLLARGGVGAFLQGWMFNAEPNLDSIAKVSDLRLQESEEGGDLLTYRLTLAGTGGPLSVRAWLNPEGTRILKRRMTWTSGDDESEFTETYPSLVLDAELPDEQFRLPEKGK